ncbi:MAG TPA: glycogen synthase GlgA [Kofleriaceae bacterium]|nr:glycogen synthase GlgA [Kofleriaceae bacterium]
MRILHVASELAPFAQTGGLGDVAAGLPAAQAALGEDTAVLVPLYRGVATQLVAAGLSLDSRPLPIDLGPHRFEGALRIAQVGRVRCGFLDVPALYDRDGGPYGPGGTAEFGDNHVRFGALGKAALAAGSLLFGGGGGTGGGVDVLHAHDWQGSPAVIYAHLERPELVTVTTIHNLAFRGIFPKHVMTELGIPWTLFTSQLAEFYDQLSFLKGALALSGAVTTVSPTYAHEILTPELGEGLDGFLRWDVRRVVGIANGIDAAAWNPATDAALPARFSAADLAGKRSCRAQLAAEAGLPPPDDATPLIGVVARMTYQKGFDLLAAVVPALGALGAKLVLIGSGEPALEAWFRQLARDFPAHVAVRIGFDRAYSRRIYGGSDLFAMPSRFEPCGLGQLYAMRYGAVPIVHAVGGLRDTVVDPAALRGRRGTATGIRFTEATPAALHAALARAVALFRDPPAFAALQRGAMARDSSWTGPAHEYVQLYRSLQA